LLSHEADGQSLAQLISGTDFEFQIRIINTEWKLRKYEAGFVNKKTNAPW
jgi:hypothetical protein